MNKKFIPFALVIVLVLAGIALWLGLRGSGGSIRGNADITVYAPEGTEIIVIESNEAVSEEDVLEGDTPNSAETYRVESSGELYLNLENGTYDILGNRGEEYYPWIKEVTVSGLFATELYPFFLPVEPTLEVTTDENALEAFAAIATLPTAETPRVNTEETAEMYVEGNTVFINWTGDVALMPEFICPGDNVEDCQLQPFYTFNTSVENVEFYGENDERIIADLGQIVVVVELDRRGTQNVQPLYIGASPIAFRVVNEEIYLSEAGVVSKVVLE
ncbi:MAG: hypothetical protein WDZ74_01725 [Candidatus Paceibacterota bacterium]